MNRSALLAGAAPIVGHVGAKPSVRIAVAAPTQAPADRPKLAICIPSMSMLHADFSQCLAGLVSFMTPKAQLSIQNEKSSMITLARNNLVRRSLDLDAEWIFMLDSDMVLPHDAAARLMAHNKDIVGATYNKRVPPFHTLGKLKGEARKLEGGIVEAEFMPGGCLMIKADVFRKLTWPWFFETYIRDGWPVDSFIEMLRDQHVTEMPPSVEALLRSHVELYQWLASNIVKESGDRITSEDYMFCRKARRAGYSIWCDLDLTWQMGHIGEQVITCKPVDKVADPVVPPASPEDQPAMILV